jgi:hypothetical protein
MGIKLGDISPLAGAISGKGMFGRGLAKLADSGAGMLVPMSYLAQNRRDKTKAREEEAAMAAAATAGARGRGRGGMLAKLRPDLVDTGMKKGGKVKKMAKGGSVSSASKRGDGCATKGKTKGRFV